nr:MAG: ORF1 [Torque teno midi virus]
MPFWWRRRRKPWLGYRFRRRQPNYRRRKRRLYKRRRPFRTNRRRRRRRRHRKVRRKRKQLYVKQWQPSSIIKCKIKGLTVLVLGADGRQSRCYTDNKLETVMPKTPSGGGFGYELYNLKYLYSEYQSHNNVWTASNNYKDLCRYTGCKITVFRHPTQDFILQYDTQPPFDITKLTYMQTHPYLMLLQKHHRIILSTQTNPKGKLTKTFRIKPPKEMQTNWFFQKNFAAQPLVALKAAACNMRYSYLQCCNENQQLSINYLNLGLYQFGNWLDASQIYHPYNTAPMKKTYYCKDIKGNKYQFNLQAQTQTEAISYSGGWFDPKFLQAVQFYTNSDYTTIEQANIPVNYLIYNPNLDDGPGNKIFLHSLTSAAYRIPQDENLQIMNVPLWLGLFGLLDWIKKKYNTAYYTSHCICLQSKALLFASQPGATKTVIPLDKSFIQGNQYFNQPPTTTQKTRWYPTIDMQLQTINDIVESGPYIPKLTNEKLSTWELKARYTFYFKWGGPQVSDPTVNNPEKQGLYPTPNTDSQTIQICNPEKQKTETMFHDWDLRRGCIKESAFKRMYDNLSTSTDISEATNYSPQKKRQRLLPCLQTQEEKKKEIQTCLRSLFEEDTCQESQDLKQLIQQQQQQQHNLKQHIYKLLLDLKQNQNLLQLHTGLLN